MIGADVFRQRLTCSGAIEHPAHGHTIDISRRDTEANDAAREDVHHDHDPVALQQDRFAAEQVYSTGYPWHAR